MEEKTMKNNQIDTENKKLEEAIAYFRQKNKAKIAEAKAETKPENTEKEDKVGYKQPPKKHQFQKGQSGNPKGRKKKPVPESLFEALTLAAHELADVFDPVTETYSKARKLERRNREDVVIVKQYSTGKCSNCIKTQKTKENRTDTSLLALTAEHFFFFL